MKVFTFFAGFAACIIISSCNDNEAMNNLLGTTISAPVYSGHKVVSGQQVDFYFSTNIKVLAARFQPEVTLAPAAAGSTVMVTMAEEYSGGEKFIADILVEDQNGSTLNVLVPFRTRNDNMPMLQINEIRFDYSKPRAEFIEFRARSSGNLGAIRLFVISADPSGPIYEFPPVQVAAGEYILLHMRTLATDRAIDEVGSQLNLAQAGYRVDYSDTVRDLWLPVTKKLLHKTDVIYLLDQDDNIIDGIMTAETTKAWEKNAAFTRAAEFLAKQGRWNNKSGVNVRTPEAEDAVPTNEVTLTRTLNRSAGADTRSAADWYTCASSGNSPGFPNNQQ